MTQKLALYFLSQGDGATRVLEADQQPEYIDTDGIAKKGWVIGRHAISAICFRNDKVSKAHAVVSAKVDKEATLAEKDLMWVWELTDRVSTNGTYLESQGHSPYRLAPGVPYEITEGSVAQFGSYQARIKFSFDIDDTHGLIGADTDQNTGLSEAKLAKKEHPNTPWFVPAILDPGWLWFTAQSPLLQGLILILVAALAALWIHKQ